MLSENIKTIRKNKGYSQEELASKLFVTRQTISKWENGQTVPNAEMLKQMADVFEVSVSELVEGDAERVLENAVIVDQLSRVNENLTIAQKRSKRTTKIVVIVCIAVFVVLLAIGLIIGLRLFHVEEERGDKVSGMEHIGSLTFTLPSSDFYHRKDDIGVGPAEDGKEQILAKTYKCYDDMTVVTIWYEDYDEYQKERIEEFKKTHSEELQAFTGDNGSLPEEVDFYIAASDGKHTGTYYSAIMIMKGKVCSIGVENGDFPLPVGESIAASMRIDNSLPEEIIDPSYYGAVSGVNATAQIPGSDARYDYDGPSLDEAVSFSCPDGFEEGGSGGTSKGIMISQDFVPVDGDGWSRICICLEQFGDQVTPYSYLQKIDFENKTIGERSFPVKETLEVEGNPAYYYEDLLFDRGYLIKHGDVIISIKWDDKEFADAAKEVLDSLHFKSTNEARQESED